MVTKNKPHKLIVVLGLPPRIADFIVRAGAIHDAMAANGKAFPSPPLGLAVLASQIADVTAKQIAASARTKGAAADRDTAMKVVAVSLGQLRGYVEQVVNQDPANAASLAADADMSVRKSTHSAKPPLAAKHPSSGTVHLMAKAIKGGKTNDWQCSTDGGKTWTSVPSTTKARTTVTGLQSATVVSFRHRAVTKAGPQDWSQPIAATVT